MIGTLPSAPRPMTYDRLPSNGSDKYLIKYPQSRRRTPQLARAVACRVVNYLTVVITGVYDLVARRPVSGHSPTCSRRDDTKVRGRGSRKKKSPNGPQTVKDWVFVAGPVARVIFTRDSICYNASMPRQFRPSLCLSVRLSHTRALCQNG